MNISFDSPSRMRRRPAAASIERLVQRRPASNSARSGSNSRQRLSNQPIRQRWCSSTRFGSVGGAISNRYSITDRWRAQPYSSSKSSIGDDPANAKSWPVVLRWDPEWDKLGHGDVAPINDAVANALDAHLRRYPVIGDGWSFPTRGVHPSR